MELKQRKRKAKQGINKAFKALKRIIDFNMLDKPKLNGLTTETTKIELANSYLEKAFKNESNK
jgi:hypothetical protein